MERAGPWLAGSNRVLDPRADLPMIPIAPAQTIISPLGFSPQTALLAILQTKGFTVHFLLRRGLSVAVGMSPQPGVTREFWIGSDGMGGLGLEVRRPGSSSYMFINSPHSPSSMIFF